jgi:hypothetical protein
MATIEGDATPSTIIEESDSKRRTRKPNFDFNAFIEWVLSLELKDENLRIKHIITPTLVDIEHYHVRYSHPKVIKGPLAGIETAGDTFIPYE